MPEESILRNRWVRAVIALLLFVALLVLAWLLRPVLVPLFFAFIAAYVFDPVVDFFERRRVRRMVTILALALIGLGALLSIPLYVVPSVIRESEELVQLAQQRMKAVQPEGQRGFLETWINKLPLDDLVDALGWAPPPAEGETEPPAYDPLAVILEQLGTRVRENAAEFIQNYGSRILEAGSEAGATVAGVFASAGRTLVNVVLAIGNFALFAFVAGYLLRDYDRIVAAANELIPPGRRARVSAIMGKIDGQMRGFMRGQAFVCLFLGTFYAIGLSIAGVPFGFVLGVFGGAASFVPYLGLILTIVPAGVLCVVQHGGIDWQLAVVAATFIIAQMLEGTVITPKLVGDQVGLGPVWVILAVLVFGNAFGLLGLLIAVPVAASLKVLIAEAIQEYKKSRFYTGPSAGISTGT